MAPRKANAKGAITLGNANRRTRPSHSRAPFTSTSRGRATTVDNSANEIMRLHRLRGLQAALLQLDPDSEILLEGFHASTAEDLTQNGNSSEDSPHQSSDQTGEVDELGTMPPLDSKPKPKPRTLLPTARSEAFFARFRTLLPDLIDPYLQYWTAIDGGRSPSTYSTPDIKLCRVHPATRPILCIARDSYNLIRISACDCAAIAPTLVRAGYFPSSPLKITICFAIDLLDFYFHLYQESSDATTALAAALKNFLDDRGFPFLDSKGQPIDDPIRRSLGHSILWYDMLRIEVEKQVQTTIDDAANTIRSLGINNSGELDIAALASAPITGPPSAQSSTPIPETDPPNVVENGKRGSCSSELQDRCPACFADTTFGRDHDSGSDIHVAVDANFSQRHARSSGETPDFYTPTFMISKEEVDAMAEHIATVRKKPNPRFVPKIPDVAVDACQKTFDAADPTVKKTKANRFDDMGLVALVCRHDIPLFLCNVDTPGEDQKYAWTLISTLLKHLPDNATLTIFYDIGCVLDRSMGLYAILPLDAALRIRWATSAMHAYGHEWACQISYNPRLLPGTGLTDGEGVERLWSGMRKLIPITRSSGRKKRLYLVDRRASHIASTKRQNLGGWMRNRLLNSMKSHRETALGDVSSSLCSVAELKREWEAQLSVQKSARSHAPAKLKQSLQSVMKLQDAIEHVDRQIEDLRQAMALGPAGNEQQCAAASAMWKTLCDTQKLMVQSAESFYKSLNVPEEFPQLHGVSFEYIHALLGARDVKIVLRNRIVGRYFEIARLDQAIGGADVALGTKLHQVSRGNISKRTPATISAIKKFNDYCNILKELANPEWNIPLPRPLPTTLDALKDDPYLYEDVWIDQMPGGAPRWMVDQNVRQGIKGMLKLERCTEEDVRLQREANNLRRWYERRLTAVTVAIEIAARAQSPLCLHLARKQERLIRLRFSWSNPHVSTEQWEKHVHNAEEVRETFVLRNPEDTTSHSNIDHLTQGIQNGTSLPQPPHRLQVPHHPPAHPPASVPLFAPSLGLHSLRQYALTSLQPAPHSLTAAIAEALDEADVDVFEDTQLYGDDQQLLGTLAELGIDEEEEDLDVTEPYRARNNTPPSIKMRPSRSIEDGRGPIFGGLLIGKKDTCREINFTDQPARLTACYGPSSLGFTSLDLPPASFSRLVNVTSRLDDLVMNSAAALLAETFYRNNDRFVILPTYFLSTHRDGADITSLWKYIERVRKQSVRHVTPKALDHGLWIIPIHRLSPLHWTLIAFDFDKQTIVHFDSFADASTRESDTQTSVAAMADILKYAASINQATWVSWVNWKVYAALYEPVQTNDYDCGVWVLAQILAILKGFGCTGLREHMMPRFRIYISHLAANAATKNWG